MKKRVVRPKLFRLLREECGTELVEFAMTAMLIMSLTIGVIGFAMAMYTLHFVSYAAQKGVRFAIVHGHTWSKDTTVNCSTSAPPSFTMVYGCTASATDIQNYVQSLATGGISPSGVTITTTSSYVWPGATPDCASSCSACATANSQSCVVKVTVNYSFNFLPTQKLSALSISATSEGAILQ